MAQYNDTQNKDIQHNDNQHTGLVYKTQQKLHCHYTECRVLFIAMVNVIMLNVFVHSVNMLIC